MQRFLLWLRPRLSSVLIVAGLGTLLVGGFVIVAPWYASEQWRNSPEAARAQRNADVSPPIWLTPAPARALRQPGRPQLRYRRRARWRRASLPTPAPPPATRQPVGPGFPVPATAAPEAVAFTPTPAVSALQLTATEFQFLDPPEPGASARLTVTVHNPTDTPAARSAWCCRWIGWPGIASTRWTPRRWTVRKTADERTARSASGSTGLTPSPTSIWPSTSSPSTK